MPRRWQAHPSIGMSRLAAFTTRSFLVTVRLRGSLEVAGIAVAGGWHGEEAGAVGGDTAGECAAGTYSPPGVPGIPAGPGTDGPRGSQGRGAREAAGCGRETRAQEPLYRGPQGRGGRHGRRRPRPPRRT